MLAIALTQGVKPQLGATEHSKERCSWLFLAYSDNKKNSSTAVTIIIKTTC